MPPADIDQLYADHGDELYRFLASRVRCVQTAADLKQEVFVRLMASSSTGVLENPRAYLFRIASNLITDHFRVEARTPLSGDGAAEESLPDAAPGPEQQVMGRDAIARLQQAIDSLPARQREILMLHKFEGLSYDEIADRLGISRNTVTVHMVRGLARCRDALSD